MLAFCKSGGKLLTTTHNQHTKTMDKNTQNKIKLVATEQQAESAFIVLNSILASSLLILVALILNHLA